MDNRILPFAMHNKIDRIMEKFTPRNIFFHAMQFWFD